MNAAVVVCFIWLAAVALAGVALTVGAQSVRLPAWTVETGRRMRVAIAASAESLGRVVTAVVIAAAGLMLLIVVLWILGVIAHHTQNHTDWPAFRWFQHRQVGGTWQHAWNELTQMGNRRQTQALTVLAAIVFSVVWRVRRGAGWWVPFFGLPLAYLMEKYGGTILGKVVNRGHPPTTLGTWVSGGCARLIIVYGLIALMTVRLYGIGRKGRMAAFSIVGFLAAVEAYSRTYLLKHWITDVVGGLLFGIGLLLVASLAFSVFEPSGDQAAPELVDIEADRQVVPATRTRRTSVHR